MGQILWGALPFDRLAGQCCHSIAVVSLSVLALPVNECFGRVRCWLMQCCVWGSGSDAACKQMCWMCSSLLVSLIVTGRLVSPNLVGGSCGPRAHAILFSSIPSFWTTAFWWLFLFFCVAWMSGSVAVNKPNAPCLLYIALVGQNTHAALAMSAWSPTRVYCT